MSSRGSRGRPPTVYPATSHYPSQTGPIIQLKPLNPPFEPSGGMVSSLEASPSSRQQSQLKPQQATHSKDGYPISFILASQATSNPVFGPDHYFAQSIPRSLVDRPADHLPSLFDPYRFTQHGVTQTTRYPERPHERPLIQPQTSAELVPKRPVDPSHAIDQRISVFDQETQKLIRTYGGYPMSNTVKVLEKVEGWRLEHGSGPLTVHRKGDAKGGVSYVICNVCHTQPPPSNAKVDPSKDKSKFTSVQKAAEHLTSFHWEMPIWQCREDGCVRSFRRKQECDRHEEFSHGRIAPKKSARMAKEASQSEAQLEPVDTYAPSPKKKATRAPSTSVKTQRYGRQGRTNASASADHLSVMPAEQGIVGPARSRSPSRVRDDPYTSSHPGRNGKRVASAPAFREGDFRPADLGMSMTNIRPKVHQSPEMTGSPVHSGLPQIVVSKHGDFNEANQSRRGVLPASTMGHFDPAQSFRYRVSSTSAQYNPSGSLHNSTLPTIDQSLPTPNYHGSMDGTTDGGNISFSPADIDETWLTNFFDGIP